MDHSGSIRLDRDMFEQVLGDLPTPVQVFDANGISAWMNEAQRAFLGLPDRQVGVGEFNVLTDPFSVGTGNAAFFAQAYETGQPVTCPDIEVDLGEATEQWGTARRTALYQQRLVPMVGPEGEVRGVAAMLTDITAQHRVESTLAELARSNETLEAFASMASHDLRTPLATLHSWLALLAEEELSEQGRSYLVEASDEADRMLSLIGRLRTLSRANLPLELAVPVDLTAAANEAVSELATTIERTSASITIGALPTVNGDAELLRQVFVNLLSNAIKFSGDGAEVQVDATELAEGVWQVRVSDRGIGIAEDAPDVFAPFVRLHGEDAFPGTGLGLAISRAVVERHGGTIAIGSRPGGGAIVTFTLPG